MYACGDPDGETGGPYPAPPPSPHTHTSVLSILMYGVISLTDAMSYDNVFFAAVGIVV